MAGNLSILVLLVGTFTLVGCAGSPSAGEGAAIPAVEGDPAAQVDAATGDSGADDGFEVEVASGSITFAIDPGQSEVRFVIGEVLAGQPNTVIGVNQQVTGSAQVSFEQPGASQMGEIHIQASGFQTDSDLRDRAINQFVLQSSSFPAIRFVPSAISGLPQVVAPGDRLSLEIQGELVIREISQPVTFTADLTVVSANQLEGTATATVMRADYDLEIPQVPRVAAVDEEFTLEIDFVMLAG